MTTGLWYLFAAYTSIWVILGLYLVGLGRRASRLEREVEALKRERGLEQA